MCKARFLMVLRAAGGTEPGEGRGVYGKAASWQALCGLAGGAQAVGLWVLIDRWVK